MRNSFARVEEAFKKVNFSTVACLHKVNFKPFLTLCFAFTCAGRFVLAVKQI